MQRPFDSGPAAPVDVAISDVPVAPVAVSFVSEPPAKVPLPATRRTPERASSARRIAGWAIDLTFLALLLAAHILAAARIGGILRSAPELLLGAPALWIAVGAALALALFGFVLALFDLRGQTLHDKLCRCVAVVD